MGRSHSVLSYDCRPQVLEFRLRATEDNNVGNSSPDDSGRIDVTPITQARRTDNGRSVTSTALAITVYGKSRDLVSESDPLFFEVGINAPISVSQPVLPWTARHLSGCDILDISRAFTWGFGCVRCAAR